MKLARSVIFLSALVVSSPTSATTIELRAMSCAQFLALGKDDLSYTLAFLDGYYRTEDDPLIIDNDGTRIKKLAEHCIANPSEDLITAADKLLKKE